MPAPSTPPNHEQDTAAVVLVHYGDPAVTKRCVASLAAEERQPHRIYIADHDPGTRLEETLADLHPGVRILPRDNLGFGPGCNAAADWAFREGAQWVWFLNNDATLPGPVLSCLIELSKRHPEVGLWGTLQLDGQRCIGTDRLPRWFGAPPGTPSFAPLPLEPGLQRLGPEETLSGASILVTRAAWERLGPWPEWCFLYWEDVIWGLRAHQKGIPAVMTELAVIHPRNTTVGRHSALSTYYGVRNELLLHADLWPSRHGTRLLHGLHILQKRLFQGNWGMLGPAFRGILDARKGLRGKR
jgi:GT2 family glycosyltransferase